LLKHDAHVLLIRISFVNSFIFQKKKYICRPIFIYRYMKDANVFEEKHHRESVRLEGFDYGTDGAYFVTICSYKKKPTFSEIVNGETFLSPLGKIIKEELERTIGLRKNVTVTDWVVMPNHVHCIVFIHKDSDGPEHLAQKGSYLYFPEGYRNKFGPQRNNLASVIRGIKSAVTTRVKIAGMPSPVWQRSFHEHVIRNESELKRIVLYIHENPINWEIRGDYPENM
jgi:putative transposase